MISRKITMKQMDLDKKSISILLVSFHMFLGLNRIGFAAEAALESALSLIQQGAYASALAKLNEVTADSKSYWQGVCHFKMQNFKEASIALQTAVNLDSMKSKSNKFKDAYFQLGQAYYALENYPVAIKAFAKSALIPYKRGPSLYYMGYSSQKLRDYDRAIGYYQELLKLDAASRENLEQAAYFQIAEINAEKAKSQPKGRKRDELIRLRAIPYYEKSASLNPESLLGIEAQQKLQSLSADSRSELPRTANGSIRPAKAWVIRLTQEFKYDTNIINEPDNRIIKISNTAAPLSRTSVFGKYEVLAWNRLAITPEVGAEATLHGRRGEAYVYSNDNTALNPALRLRLDHRVQDKPAAALAEYEYGVTTRDYSGVKEQKYFSRTNNFVLGERWELLRFGPFTVKANLKFVENSNRRLNFWAPGLNLNQSWKTFQNYLLNTGFTFENQRSNDPFYDQRNYRFNLSYSMPALFWQTNVDAAFSANFADIINQPETRGLEKNLSPSITLTRVVDRAAHISVSLNYAYTRNLSHDDENFSYSKHTAGVGGTLTF